MTTQTIRLPANPGFRSMDLADLLERYIRFSLGQALDCIPKRNFIVLGVDKIRVAHDRLEFVEKRMRPMGGYYGVHSKDVADRVRAVYDIYRSIRHIRATEILNATPKSQRVERFCIDAAEPFMTYATYRPDFSSLQIVEDDIQGEMTLPTEMLEIMREALVDIIAFYSGDTKNLVEVYRRNTEIGKSMPLHDINMANDALASISDTLKAGQEWRDGATTFLASLPEPKGA